MPMCVCTEPSMDSCHHGRLCQGSTLPRLARVGKGPPEAIGVNQHLPGLLTRSFHTLLNIVIDNAIWLDAILHTLPRPSIGYRFLPCLVSQGAPCSVFRGPRQRAK